MKSYDVIKQAVEDVGVKQVAWEMKLSQSLIYKWCQPPTAGEDDASGARNPLDRVIELMLSTHDQRLIEFLAAAAGGTFVPDVPTTDDISAEFISRTQQIIHEFSDLLDVLSTSMANDGKITPEEAEKIRKEWQELKQKGEMLVCACEQGVFCEDA